MPTLPKLEDLVGEADAEKLLASVQSYEGWKNAMQRGRTERLKFDSEGTKNVDTALQKLQAPKGDLYTLNEIQERVADLKTIANLTLKWLEDKVSADPNRDNPRFKTMLALNTWVNLQLNVAQKIEVQIIDRLSRVKNHNTFFSLHKEFKPPGEKLHPPLVPTVRSDNVLTQALAEFRKEINEDWDFDNVVLKTLADDIDNFHKKIDPKDTTLTADPKLTEEFIWKLEQYQAAAKQFKMPQAVELIEKHKNAINNLKEIYGETPVTRKRS